MIHRNVQHLKNVAALSAAVFDAWRKAYDAGDEDNADKVLYVGLELVEYQRSLDPDEVRRSQEQQTKLADLRTELAKLCDIPGLVPDVPAPPESPR